MKGEHTMTKAIKLHTYDLQRTVIALIEAHSNRKHVTKDPEEAEAYDRLSDLFADLNLLCTADNDYTLTVTVDDRSEEI
jgi:hypothetical protein